MYPYAAKPEYDIHMVRCIRGMDAAFNFVEMLSLYLVNGPIY